MELRIALALTGTLALACGDDTDTPVDMGMATPDMGMAASDMGMATPDMGMATPDMGTPDMGTSLMTEAEIKAFLEGKTMVMAGMDIPTEPNGFNENLNLGAATQCYNSSTIVVMGGQFQVTSMLGTIANMMCDRDTVSATAGPFTSTALTLSNIMGNAECFDVDAAYTGFAQEGRARIAADGTTVEMELFFMGQATGHRCADGMVGATGVTLMGMPFSGNAVQTYRIQ